MAIESDLPLYGKTQSLKEGQQAATVDEACIITKVTWTSQSLNEPTHGNCKVGWWGDSIVHQYEMGCQSLHLLQDWKTLANIHLMKDHAGNGIIERSS
jgi:phage gp46-like protein